ncbi:MAG TPA: hypothetical protein VIW80_18050 [Pyrinomonadaceae bacterium]
MYSRRWHLRLLSALALGLLCVASGAAQSPATTPQTPTGVLIRLRVRPRVEGKERGLARKRFFLIRGGRAENQALIENLERSQPPSLECYYRSIGASEALIRWLKENDCESVYCREIDESDTEGQQAVPEFQAALAQGRKEFGSLELARKWLTVNLREEIRSGFYKRQQETLRAFIKQAEAVSKSRVLSVMTDRNGTAYFTDLAPGAYVISNLVPAELAGKGHLWNCELKVKADEAGTERPFLLSTQKGGSVKCVSIEKPPPPCAETKK